MTAQPLTGEQYRAHRPKSDRTFACSDLPARVINGESSHRVLMVTALERDVNEQASARNLLGKRCSDRAIVCGYRNNKRIRTRKKTLEFKML